MDSLSLTLFALVPPGQGGDAGGGIASLVPIFIVFGIFYFLLIRPQTQQRKQHESMLQSLKKGDKIVTTGGLHATILGLMGDTLKVRISDNVSVQIDRAAVATRRSEADAKETKETKETKDKE